jgi:hypothetical protein
MAARLQGHGFLDRRFYNNFRPRALARCATAERLRHPDGELPDPKKVWIRSVEKSDLDASIPPEQVPRTFYDIAHFAKNRDPTSIHLQ